MPMKQEEVFEKVRETLVDALNVDDEEVTPKATLQADLGAESIDYLDIIFRLEKTFNIKIPRGELFPDNVLNNPQFVSDGKLTAPGLQELKARMPHADFADFESDPKVDNVPSLFTVDAICNYVTGKVAS